MNATEDILKQISPEDEAILQGINPADMKRAHKYALDLGRGLNILRTFPQGVTIFGSARLKEDNRYYKMARELGQLLAQNGHATITGGGPGIMEAANRGAFEYGGRSIGLNIYLPQEQFANPYLTDCLEFHYFFARKVMLTMASKVYVFFPGGFGSMDELTEILCLMQEDKTPKMPIFLVGKSYWKGLDHFFQSKMLPMELIKKADRKIYTITDDVTDIVKAANRIGHFKVKDNLYDDAEDRAIAEQVAAAEDEAKHKAAEAKNHK